MDQPGSSELSPPLEATANPVVAVGRKVKSMLTSHQRPSVRIQRGGARPVPATQDFAEKPLPQLPPRGPDSSTDSMARDAAQTDTSADLSRQNTFASRFAGARARAGSTVQSLFIATLSTLTNVQNSLFVPSLGRFVNRQPTYRVTEDAQETQTMDKIKAKLKSIAGIGEEGEKKKKIDDTLSSCQYAILPDDKVLVGWTPENKEELDDRVRHMLHSRRAKMKRAMKGFRQYVRRPFGLFITVYATLITLFGAAWVLFLIGWISLGAKQDYVVNIIDNIMVALFAIIGDGLAPFRAVDTYHMIYIAHYHRKTWKKREKLGLPKLADHNDLPDQRMEDVQPKEVDIESLIARRMPRSLARRIAPRIPKRYASRMTARATPEPSYDYTVLTDEEQAKLEYHERKFSKSHTFYKPHETATHYAFPLKLLVAIVVLLDLHSCLQITLGACTWGINYHTRPFALTTVILCFSITCNITGGVLISKGDKRTRKKDVIERMMRQELTEEAIDEMEARWMKEAEDRGDIDKSVRKRFEEERDAEENEEIKKSWKTVPLLPKKLLGKGEDHRQPALPQEARGSGSKVNVAGSSSGASTPRKPVPVRSNLTSLQENPGEPSRPNPALLARKEASKEGKGEKVMRMIRRADLDRS
ncbi:hypothetical protein L207DRAFT_482043 [Hyaloscypha variabilis F]|uniref:Integral membrane protein n=1 Tax=Hyaloscypha variabilis (strain UAMH 11265 / GT02V1 / F) TaxID=1149755 RepID=A0A2J6S4A6_HYAVF|nr:hypothetical protein L207DRAFT_482043 [Hyaloscypha variabilis F]